MRMTQFTASPDCLNQQGIPQGVSVERHEGGVTTIRIRQGDDCTMVCVADNDHEAIAALRAATASLPKARPYYHQLLVMDARSFGRPNLEIIRARLSPTSRATATVNIPRAASASSGYATTRPRHARPSSTN
jgi:hypothetical protein